MFNMIPTMEGWDLMGREMERGRKGNGGKTREITGFWSQVDTGVQGFVFGFFSSSFCSSCKTLRPRT